MRAVVKKIIVQENPHAAEVKESMMHILPALQTLLFGNDATVLIDVAGEGVMGSKKKKKPKPPPAARVGTDPGPNRPMSVAAQLKLKSAVEMLDKPRRVPTFAGWEEEGGSPGLGVDF